MKQRTIAESHRIIERNLKLATFFAAWACLNCVVLVVIRVAG